MIFIIVHGFSHRPCQLNSEIQEQISSRAQGTEVGEGTVVRKLGIQCLIIHLDDVCMGGVPVLDVSEDAEKNHSFYSQEAYRVR